MNQDSLGQITKAILTEQERKKKLADNIMFACARGWTVESQNDYNAILVSGQKCNHVLHALITFLGGTVTCGVLLLWGIPWAIFAATQKEERIILRINEYGEISRQRL